MVPFYWSSIDILREKNLRPIMFSLKTTFSITLKLLPVLPDLVGAVFGSIYVMPSTPGVSLVLILCSATALLLCHANLKHSANDLHVSVCHLVFIQSRDGQLLYK